MGRSIDSSPVQRFCRGDWEWFLTTEDPPYEVTGKYLFFSTDRDLLIRIAIEELASGQFHQAKIPVVGMNVSEEYVLCLYYLDDSKKRALAAKYRDQEGLAYRYWKSDATTLSGAYSEQFLSKLKRPSRDR